VSEKIEKVEVTVSRSPGKRSSIQSRWGTVSLRLGRVGYSDLLAVFLEVTVFSGEFARIGRSVICARTVTLI